MNDFFDSSAKKNYLMPITQLLIFNRNRDSYQPFDSNFVELGNFQENLTNVKMIREEILKEKLMAVARLVRNQRTLSFWKCRKD